MNKKCKFCGSEFSKNSKYRISQNNWDKQEYCSLPCGLRLRPHIITEKARLNMSNSHLGKKHTKEQIEKIRAKMTGRPCSEITRKKIGDAQRGEKNHAFIHNKPIKIPVNRKGSNCHFWKGGITPENEAERKSLNYRTWRKSVFERDDYTCQECKVKGGYLHAHHIKSFAWFPELRFAIDNGVTLCVICHKATDTFGGKNRKKSDAISKAIEAL